MVAFKTRGTRQNLAGRRITELESFDRRRRLRHEGGRRHCSGSVKGAPFAAVCGFVREGRVVQFVFHTHPVQDRWERCAGGSRRVRHDTRF